MAGSIGTRVELWYCRIREGARERKRESERERERARERERGQLDLACLCLGHYNPAQDYLRRNSTTGTWASIL